MEPVEPPDGAASSESPAGASSSASPEVTAAGGPVAPGGEGPPPSTFALKKTPTSRRLLPFLFSLLVGVLPAVALPLLWFTLQKAISLDVAAGLAIAACFGVVAWTAWLFALPKPSPIVVDDAGLRFPYARRGDVQLALDEILVCRVERGALILLAAVADSAVAKGVVGAFVVPARCFVDADGAVAVEAAVRARMARHGNGPGLLSRLDDNAERQRAFASKRPLITWAVVGACVVFFGLEVFVGALSDPSGQLLVVVGANAARLVKNGEVWRVVTACLLHGSLLHLFVNASSLLSTGALIERWLGRSGYAVVLFVSGVVGHIASALWPRAAMSVGISGAVFGLVGVLAWSTLRFRGTGLGGLRVPLSGWVVLVVANGAISALPFVDVVAHGAGFVAGFVVAVVVAPRPGKPALASPRQRFVAAVVAGVVVVAAVVVGAVAGVVAVTG